MIHNAITSFDDHSKNLFSAFLLLTTTLSSDITDQKNPPNFEFLLVINPTDKATTLTLVHFQIQKQLHLLNITHTHTNVCTLTHMNPISQNTFFAYNL